MERLQQVHIDSVDVEVTEDLFEDGSRPPLEFEDPSLDFYGLTAIQYQGEIILWLQREYGLHVQVKYTLTKTIWWHRTNAKTSILNTRPVSLIYFY